MVRLKVRTDISGSIAKIFQFHMVRLKALGWATFGVSKIFQFHMVRLKGEGPEVQPAGEQRDFNSIWCD